MLFKCATHRCACFFATWKTSSSLLRRSWRWQTGVMLLQIGDASGGSWRPVSRGSGSSTLQVADIWHRTGRLSAAVFSFRLSEGFSPSFIFLVRNAPFPPLFFFFEKSLAFLFWNHNFNQENCLNQNLCIYTYVCCVGPVFPSWGQLSSLLN